MYRKVCLHKKKQVRTIEHPEIAHEPPAEESIRNYHPVGNASDFVVLDTKIVLISFYIRPLSRISSLRKLRTALCWHEKKAIKLSMLTMSGP